MKVLIIACFFSLTFILMVGGVHQAQAQSKLPLVTSHEIRAYVRATGNVAIEERIMFATSIPSADFLWSVPSGLVRQPKLSVASGPLAETTTQSRDRDRLMITGRGEGFGSVYHVSYVLHRPVQIEGEKAIFQWQPFVQPTTVIHESTVTLALPEAVPDEAIEGRVFAANDVGTDVNVGADSIIITLNSIGPQSFASVVLGWKNTVIAPTLAQKITTAVAKAGGQGVALSIILLPASVLFVFLIILFHHAMKDRVKPAGKSIATPPSFLSPAVVGTLYHRRFDRNSLLSILLDLTVRGYIDIIEHNGVYSFGRLKSGDDLLLDWEKALYNQLFSGKTVQIDSRHAEAHARSRLINTEILTGYESVYEATTRLGFFSTNPHLIAIRYKLIGLGFYLVGLGVFGLMLHTQNYLIFFIPVISLLVTSFVVLRLSSLMAVRNPLGNAELARWLQFRTYLKDRAPLAPNESTTLFLRYLPYALVLGVVDEWTYRFRKHIIMQPFGFVSFSGEEPNRFAQKFLRAIKRLSRTLMDLQGPVVQ